MPTITRTYETSGYYGTDDSRQTNERVYVAELSDCSYWYCINDSQNINLTLTEIVQGCNLEIIDDIDTCRADNPVCSIDDLLSELSDLDIE